MIRRQSDEIQYELLVQAVTDHAIFMLDLDGLVRSWNAGAERIKGYTAQSITGRHFSIFYSQEDQATGVPERCLAIARAKGHSESQGWRLRQDGTRFWARAVIHAVRDDGRLVGFVKITRDCTKERRQVFELETMAGNLRLIISLLPYGVCLLDAEQRIVLFNPVFQDLFATAEKGVYLPDVIKHRLAQDGLTDSDAGALPLVGPGTAPYRINFGPSVVAVQMREAQGYGWIATFEDIAERREADRRMTHGSWHDDMTGLANGTGLGAHLEAALKACQDTGGCAVLCLDLDRFKAINEVFGHHAGDLVLREAEQRILYALRPEDFACHLGSDEFVAIPAYPITADHACAVAKRVRKQMHRPFIINGREVDIGVSIGVAVSKKGETSLNDLIGAADLALYKAKRDGRGRICCFTEKLGIAALKRRSIEMQLRQALEADEFSLVYQPICSANGHEIRGFEALLRWQQADSTLVSPADFIPIAEELGIMDKIGGWVLESACREATAWPMPLTVAVNVSATQLHDRNLLKHVRNALRLSSLDPFRLELEITETAMIGDHALTLSILRDLRAMGVMLAIDDFGTGYSSLNFLRTLPFTRIKIDRSFINDITENANSIAIVRGVMRISHDLGLSVTAEGVETEEQRQILIAESCQDLQGYLIAKPMLGPQVASFLASRHLVRVARSA